MTPATPAWLENLAALYGFGLCWDTPGAQWHLFCGKRAVDIGDEWVVSFAPSMTLPELVAILKQRGITHVK